MRITVLSGLALAALLASQTASAAFPPRASTAGTARPRPQPATTNEMPHTHEAPHSGPSTNDLGPKGPYKPSPRGVLVPGKAPATVKDRVSAQLRRQAAKKLTLPGDQKKYLYVPEAEEKKPLTLIHGSGTRQQVAEALESEGHFEEAAKHNGGPVGSPGMETLPEKLRAGAVSLNRPGLKREVYEFKADEQPKTPQERADRVFDKFFKTGNVPGKLVPTRMEGEGPVGSRSANEAYDNAGHTYNFFSAVMGRFSIDDKGMPIRAVTHQADMNANGMTRKMANAFYRNTDKHIRFGDSPEMSFTSTQITGHELAHGVTAHTAGLVYQNESGALNEHFSDVFGMAISQWKDGITVDKANWDVGGDAHKLTAGPKAQPIRSMSNPAAQGQPGHMNEYASTKSDNGGVHKNSGIPNRAFYVASMGMGGRVWERSAKVWYVSLRDYLDNDATFADAARATVHVAQQMYGHGSREHEAVKTGWKSVGIEVKDSDPAPVHRSQWPTTGFTKREANKS